MENWHHRRKRQDEGAGKGNKRLILKENDIVRLIMVPRFPQLEKTVRSHFNLHKETDTVMIDHDLRSWRQEDCQPWESEENFSVH